MNVTWKKSPENTVQNSLNNVARLFTSRNNISARRDIASRIKEAYRRSARVSLNDRIWSRVQNSQSFYSSSLEQVISSADSDPTNTLKKFVSGSVECPIILETRDGTMLLARGETVLRIARLLKVVPKAYVVKVDI